MLVFITIVYDYLPPITISLIIIFNVIEIYLILKKRDNKKKSAICFLLNLACSDIVLGVSWTLVRLLGEFSGIYTTTSYVFIIKYIMFRQSLFASLFSLMALLYLRYMGVKNPFQYKIILRKYATKICVFIWPLSLLLSVVIYFSFHFTVLDNKFENLIVTVVILVVMLCFFIHYYFIIKYTNKRKTVNTSSEKNPWALQNQNTVVVGNNRNFEENLRWYTLWSTVGFLFFWSPLAVFGVLNLFYAGTKLSFYVSHSTYPIAFCNSVFNPVLYLIALRRSAVMKKRLARDHLEKSQQLKTKT